MNGPLAHEIRMDARAAEHPDFVFGRTKFDRTAEQWLRRYKEIFGEDYYIEVQMPCLHDIYDHVAFEKLLDMADRYKIKPVLTNDAHYFDRKSFEIQKVMMAIDQDTFVTNPDLFHVNSNEQYFKTRAELFGTFSAYKYSDNIPSHAFELACDTTLEIAEKCYQPKFNTSSKIPKYFNKEPNDVDPDVELWNNVEQALCERNWYNDKTEFLMDGRKVTYRQQAELECKRFIEKGFASYFLITADLIRHGKSRGHPFGPRGCSIQTSLVTMVDNSQKQIIDISIGEQVLDGFGDIQTVENKFVYDVSEDLITIQLNNDSIVVTSDHKLYIVRDGIVMLVKASDIENTDEIINTSRDRING